jgi:putative oxidoreductase
MLTGIALLIARLIIGLGVASHGAQKLFGWFGGGGPAGTGSFFEGIGFRPGTMFAVAAGLAEFGGGLLTATGLLNPIGPALIIMVMLVATFAVHLPNGFFASNGGFELPASNIAASLLLAFTGPGPYSLDGLLNFTTFADPQWTWIVIGVAVILALLNLVARRKPGAPAA